MLNSIYKLQTNFITNDCFNGNNINIEQVLLARDQRQQLQNEYLSSCETIISLTLIAPGPIKKNLILDYIFEKALNAIEQLLLELNIDIINQAKVIKQTGHFAIWGVDFDANTLKQCCIGLEQQSPLARLWDIDVITKKGLILTRENYQKKSRECLICEEQAKVCARSRKHDFDSLNQKIKQLVINDQFAQLIADNIYQALIEEVFFAPKPGLVDSIDNGAHFDMDLNTFIVSSKAIKPFFKKFVLKGIEYKDFTEKQMLPDLRKIGIDAEKIMLKQTNNINTHKGAIFSFGLISAAIGYLFARNKVINITNICETVRQICDGLTLELNHQHKHQTAGIKIFKQHSIKGARGEAESGFDTILKAISIKKISQDQEHQKLLILVKLLAINEDTNIINRGGIDKLIWLQDQAKAILNNENIIKNKDQLKQALIKLNQQCIEFNLSPGGSADLFAIILFFYKFFKI